MRGALIRALSAQGSLTYEQVVQLLAEYDREKVDGALRQLCEEQLVRRNGAMYAVY